MFYEQESYRYEQTRFKSRVNVYIYECRKCIESDVSKTAFLKKSSIVITNVFRCNLSDFHFTCIWPRKQFGGYIDIVWKC